MSGDSQGEDKRERKWRKKRIRGGSEGKIRGRDKQKGREKWTKIMTWDSLGKIKEREGQKMEKQI